jgi:lysophospholipase L1-like esterase
MKMNTNILNCSKLIKFIYPAEMHFKKASVSIFFMINLILLLTSNCYACPLTSNYPDYNCDQKIEISVLGDSLVSGYGDSVNDNKGGYVLRTANKFKNFEINNFGVPGIRTRELLSDVIDAYARKQSQKSLYNALISSDVIVLDLGRNDRWLFGTTLETFRNLKRIRTLIQNKTAKISDVAPLIVTAVLMLPNRGSQGPWVRELNQLILESNTRSAPADLRFDLVSKRLLGSDQIHPTSEGYESLFKTFSNYISNNLRKKIKTLRIDKDKDQVYDIFETKKFGTDPSLNDTDSDGKSDYQEIFVLKTDPLIAD